MRRGLGMLAICLAGCTTFAAADGADASTSPDDGGDAPHADAADPGPGPDGGSSDTADGGSPCSSAHTFCDDFSGMLGGAWTAQAEGAGALSLATDLFGAAPPSLAIEVGPGASARASYLEKAFTASGHIVVGVTAHVAHAGAVSGELDFLVVDLVNPAGYAKYLVALLAKPNGDLVFQNQASAQKVIGVFGSSMTRLELDLNLEKEKVVVRREGVIVLSEPTPLATTAGHRLRIGAPFASNTAGSFSVRLDDVTVD